MIYNYYLEIKNRCLILIISWCFSIFIAYYYKEILIFLCIKPSLIFNNNILYLIFTDVREIFLTYFKLSIFFSNQILIYLTFFHLLIFLSPGLYKTEYKYIKKILLFSFLFWLFSIIVFNNILLPTSFKFFISFQKFLSFTSLNLHFEAKITEYFSFYFLFYYICITYCQLFIFLILFFDYINFNIKLIKKYKKIFYYCFFIISTLITPPDITSQVITSATLIFFYELFTFLHITRFIYNQKYSNKIILYIINKN